MPILTYKLYSRLPSGLSEAQNNINPSLAQALLMAGVIHCLPFIAKWAQVECECLKLFKIRDLTSINLFCR